MKCNVRLKQICVLKAVVSSQKRQNEIISPGESAIIADHNGTFIIVSFTFALMTTGAFSRNIGKLFSELKLVTDNLSLYL